MRPADDSSAWSISGRKKILERPPCEGIFPQAASFRKVPSGRPVYLIASAVVSHGPGPLALGDHLGQLCSQLIGDTRGDLVDEAAPEADRRDRSYAIADLA